MPTTLDDAVVEVEIDDRSARARLSDLERDLERFEAGVERGAAEARRAAGRAFQQQVGARAHRRIQQTIQSLERERVQRVDRPGEIALAGAKRAVGLMTRYADVSQVAALTTKGLQVGARVAGMPISGAAAGGIAAAVAGGLANIELIRPMIFSALEEAFPTLLGQNPAFQTMQGIVETMSDVVSAAEKSIAAIIPSAVSTAQMMKAQLRLGGTDANVTGLYDMFYMEQVKRGLVERTIEKDRAKEFADNLVMAIKRGHHGGVRH